VLQVPSLHMPAAHVALALGKLHAFPHDPQFAGDVVRSTSQPLAALWSQSPNPVAQPLATHVPPTHATLLPGIEHAVAHVPQWPVDVARFASQPFIGSWSQSA
jgi:hypothetical protein